MRGGKRLSIGSVAVAVALIQLVCIADVSAADKVVLEKGALRGELADGILVNVKARDSLVLKEFGRAFVNEKDKRNTDKPLQSYVLKTEKKKEKGDLFYVSEGIMRIKGKKFLGEFGRVWAARKTGELEFTFHPTYFNQKWNTPDRERPLHVDVVTVIEKWLWEQAMLEVKGKRVSTKGLAAYPKDVSRILLPVKGTEYLAIIPLNMPDSFAVVDKGKTVEVWFSDQNAMTTWYVLTDCPSCRLSLKIEDIARN